MTMQKLGSPIGALDSVLLEIRVGDEITDASGKHYTIDRFGRAKPLSAGNAVPIRSLDEPTIVKPYRAPEEPEAPATEENEEQTYAEALDQHVKAAGDQRLVDELRQRGWTVSCSRLVERVSYEEVAL